MNRVPEKIFKEWLNKAESDFQFAKSAFEVFDNFYSQICILCHDAAEKFLKAFLIFHNIKPEKIHDLVTLLKECIRITKEKDITSLEEYCRILNRYYIPLKYPSHYPPVEKNKVKEAIEAIEKISKIIKKYIIK